MSNIKNTYLSYEWTEVANVMDLSQGKPYVFTNNGEGNVYLKSSLPLSKSDYTATLDFNKTTLEYAVNGSLYARTDKGANVLFTATEVVEGGEEPIGGTDIEIHPTNDTVVVGSSTGTAGVIPEANNSDAGVLSAPKFIKYEGYEPTISALDTKVDDAIEEFQPAVKNTAPTSTDDTYPVGKKWIDTTTGEVYICTSNEIGNAVWDKIDNVPIEDLGTMAFQNSTDVDITGGNIALNNEITAPKFEGTFLTTPNYLDPAKWGVRIGENEDGSWMNFRVNNQKIMQLGTGSSVSDPYGFNTYDTGGDFRAGLGYLGEAGEIGVIATKGLNAVGLSSLDTGICSFVSQTAGNITGTWNHLGEVKTKSYETNKYTDVTSAGVKLGEASDTAYLEMRSGGNTVLTLGASDSDTNSDKYGIEISDISGNSTCGLGYSVPLSSWVSGVIDSINGNSAGAIYNSTDSVSLTVLNAGSPVFNVDKDGVLSTVAGVFPSNNGVAEQVLKSDGAGNIVWANSVGHSVDLGTTYTANDITITNTDGTEATLTPATNTDAGILTTTMFGKLDDLPDNATLQLDLGAKLEASNILGGAGISLDVSGNDVTINSDVGADVNLATTVTGTEVTITNTDGTDATIGGASPTQAGVITSSDYETLVKTIDYSQIILSSTSPVATDWDYQVGKKWINTATQDLFFLVDNTENSAVWDSINNVNPSDLGALAFKDSVDLSGTASAIDFNIDNSEGTGVTVPSVNSTSAGLMSPSDFDKLAGIEGEATKNILVAGDHISITDDGNGTQTISADAIDTKFKYSFTDIETETSVTPSNLNYITILETSTITSLTLDNTNIDTGDTFKLENLSSGTVTITLPNANTVDVISQGALNFIVKTKTNLRVSQ